MHTFLAGLQAILMHRNRPNVLLLSELGGYILPLDQAPAGTKRLSNLLRSPKWQAALISNWFWQQAEKRHQALLADKQTPYILWDESSYEKPESSVNSDFCAVRSSKAQRLKRIRPGFFHPPGKPFLVLVCIG